MFLAPKISTQQTAELSSLSFYVFSWENLINLFISNGKTYNIYSLQEEIILTTKLLYKNRRLFFWCLLFRRRAECRKQDTQSTHFFTSPGD
jgi:patatin-like phospholipase/acyl hydrolase